jgi:hypothetical protein
MKDFDFCSLQSAHIEIVANEAEIAADGSEWKPVWRHDTELGHDKALSINEARALAKEETAEDEIPLIVFIGDGVSDLPAAREADVLFARRGLRLEEYCVEHKIPYIAFDTFADIQREVEKIMKEDEEKTGGRGKPARFNPRANLWRRVSSQQAVSSRMFLKVATRADQTDVSDPTIRCSFAIKRGKDVPMA